MCFYSERGNRVGRDAILNTLKEGLAETVSFKQRSEGNETWMYGVGQYSRLIVQEMQGPEVGAYVVHQWVREGQGSHSVEAALTKSPIHLLISART